MKVKERAHFAQQCVTKMRLWHGFCIRKNTCQALRARRTSVTHGTLSAIASRHNCVARHPWRAEREKRELLFLTVEQHIKVVKNLVSIGQFLKNREKKHSAGFEYISLMVSFLLHNLSSADALLKLFERYTEKWFPVTVGYVITRTMFETDVTAHYITQNPVERSRKYIEYGSVLKKKKMDACLKHCKSNKKNWSEGMLMLWQEYWQPREKAVNDKFNAIRNNYGAVNKKGDFVAAKNWSGKSIYQMAKEVDHEESYDIFYSELSSFTHADVNLADRFLKFSSTNPYWSQKAEKDDIGHVFRFAAIFLTCFFELFGDQLKTWSRVDVQKCWQV